MTESELRIKIARNINDVLMAIYKNINNNEFDPLINLSNVPSTTLKDFWIYTAGFLGLKNQDEFDSLFSDKDVYSILDGDFHIIDLPLDVAQEYAKRSKKKVPDKGIGITIGLYSVQDGTYSIKKGFKDEKGNLINYLALQTSPLEYHTDTPLEDFEITAREILKNLRNVFAHRTPIKRGKKLVFERGEDEIVVSKMWLRGYSEMFCRKSHTLNSSNIEQLILEELKRNENLLLNKQDVDSVLSAVKHLFGENVNKNFYKLSGFVQARLNSTNFYTQPLEHKVKTLSSILANNYDYISTSAGTINPSIIYNLQQLVGLELYARNEFTELDIEDYDILKMKKVVDEVSAMNSKTMMAQTLLFSGKQFSKSAQQKFLKGIKSMKSKVRLYLQSLEDKQKLESANMELYNLEDLNYLPMEVAVNTVLLMCFNSLITSSFYDDVLAKTNTTNLNEQQEIFFNKFDVSNLQFYHGNTLKTREHPGQKAYLLLCLREALCHGTISYKIPTQKNNKPVNFNDIIICFKTSERQNSTIYGTIQDFYNLFSSIDFLRERNSEIVTGKQKEITVEEEISSLEDEENFRNLNEIVQELRFVDDQFRNL